MSNHQNFFNGFHSYQKKAFSEQLPQNGSLVVDDKERFLKYGIWAYFLLLVFEGGLRKWVLPGLATPLLVVRDPLALWLVLSVWQRGLLPKNIYLIGAVFIGVLGIYTAALFGHGNFAVAFFGARILLLHFPLMFVIGQVFDQDDVIQMGKVVLLIAIPMTVLTALQFYSPQSAWVNRGIGGDMEGAGFSGSMGYMRPPGTFSFTNGLTAFYGLAASFIVYFWFDSKKIRLLHLVGATVALLAAIPLSISRGLFFQVIVCIVFGLFLVVRKPSYVGKMIGAGIGFIIVFLVLSQISFFSTATEAFLNRFELANKSEGGMEGVLVDRYLGGMVGALTAENEVPFFGYGIGMGTNVGSMLISGGRTFLIAEGEWGRLIGELGLLMGIGVILLRLGFCAKVAFASYQKLTEGNLLPWMLLSYGLLVVPQGQWAQPTALGFSTLIGGLMVASLKKGKKSS